ncbi:hypothetical protein CNMCM6106_000223 [Aspergillus hiratsukae]|uniref:Reverse transcriptase n=1 Tax=Aspergillus hiratsukae TaxID=1194566 RepID=A0A8H6QKS5_9EURO|nr:hypothetical protein CNMCM6106_000223 [Aspergillus hiratsukae]
MAPNKAPGIDGIPAGFLQAMGDPLIKALQVLTQACWDWEYSPRVVRQARTVVLKKPRKESYNQAKSWIPIALLNTLGKVTEAVTARYLQDLAESHSLLPETQMGARRNRSTELALDLLVSQDPPSQGCPKNRGGLDKEFHDGQDDDAGVRWLRI